MRTSEHEAVLEQTNRCCGLCGRRIKAEWCVVEPIAVMDAADPIGWVAVAFCPHYDPRLHD